MSSFKISLFSDWKFCDGCGLPAPHPVDANNENNKNKGRIRKKLLLSTCTACESVAYHNVQCQKNHWKIRRRQPQTQSNRCTRGHKSDCQVWAKAMRRMKEFQIHINHDSHCWWMNLITTTTTISNERYDDNSNIMSESDRLWETGIEQWTLGGNILEAVDCFKEAMRLVVNEWDISLMKFQNSCLGMEGPKRHTTTVHFAFGRRLAKRLLFCAYCEADAIGFESCRLYLLMCISILLQCSDSDVGNDDDDVDELMLNDAWMELMLSFEEEPNHSRMARHVSNLAITSGKSCCGWRDPLQRPGYMAYIPNASQNCPSYIPREHHPKWCRTLEDNWIAIAQELFQLESTKQQLWSSVGSGERGSGNDDHRVVSGEGEWNEYVLFGTGAMPRDEDAPITKQLLREHVPSAISLAEAGGGEVIFSRLAPHTHIDSHCGPTNMRWTAHLSLVVPVSNNGGDCEIRLASTWYRWKTGKILLFDDSYEHEVRNDTDEIRTVLLLRVWHPALIPEQRMTDLTEARRRKQLAVEKRFHPPP